VVEATLVLADAVVCARGLTFLKEIGHQAAADFDRGLTVIHGLPTSLSKVRAARLLADAEMVTRLIDTGVAADAEQASSAQVREALRELGADPAAGPVEQLLDVEPEQLVVAAGAVGRLLRLAAALASPEHAAAVARHSAELEAGPNPARLISAVLAESATRARAAAMVRATSPVLTELLRVERARKSRIHATRLLELAWRDLATGVDDVLFPPPPTPDPEMLAWLRRQLNPGLYEPDFERQRASCLGADLFGLRKLPPAPDFLAGVDIRGLRPEHVAAFLRRISLTRPRPDAADLSPEALDSERGTVSTARRSPEQRRWEQPDDSNAPLLPEHAVIPHIVHGIWVGGPMPAYSAFRDHYAKAAARYAGDVDVMLWTDIPRAACEGALATPPPEQGDDPLAAARSLLTWARESNVNVINIHEVFHADHPMLLHSQYVLEMAKQLPRGYASASDHLRVELIDAFGGLYSDGDIRFDVGEPGGPIAGTVPELLDAVAASPHGFALNSLKNPLVGNDLFAGPAGHPALRLWIERARLHYWFSQREIVGAEMAGPYVGTWHHASRNIAPYRTGRVHHGVLAQLGITYDDLTPTVGVLEYHSEVTWARPPVRRPGGPPDEDQILMSTKRLVVFLIWQLITREGNLYLTAVAPVVSQLPDPDAVWITILYILAGLEEVRALVTSITDHRIGDDGSHERVRLPPEAEALLDRCAIPPRWLGSDLANTGAPVWLLDEAVTPVALRAVAGAEV
jgi:hypothetical protein